MKFQGKIVEKSEVREGVGQYGQYKCADVIVEIQDGQFQNGQPRTSRLAVCFSGDAADLQVGQMVQFDVQLWAERKDRWWNNKMGKAQDVQLSNGF